MSAQLFISLLVISMSIPVINLSCAYLIMMERKVAAYVQDRLGPNRTNFSFGLNDIWKMIGLGWLFDVKNRMLGLGQALADGLKLVVKEDYTPHHVDKVLFILAPMLVVVPALIGAAAIPWASPWLFPGLGDWVLPGTAFVTIFPGQIAILYMLAVSSLGVYGIVLGAYASNNKYSFLGGLRATAQMLSYEVPMALCILIMIITYQTASTTEMTMLQMQSGLGSSWGILTHPMIAVMFFICGLAECNRAPFDLAETEQELVGGFHTEYGSLRWALFFLAEYMHMITSSAFFAFMFLGGSDLLPFVGIIPQVNDGSFFGLFAEGSLIGGILLVGMQVSIYAAKVFVLLWLMMMVRWTLPRFRFDQLMKLAWRGMIPLMLVMLLVVTLMVALGFTSWWMFLIANVVVACAAPYLGYLLPKDPPTNRRIPLKGSRFSPA